MSKHYGVYGLDDLDISDEDVAQVWGELQDVASYAERYARAVDCLCWQCVTVAVPVVVMEDESVHDESAPFCDDPMCPCHNDAAHEEYIEQSILAGLLTTWEGSRLYWGEAI